MLNFRRNHSGKYSLTLENSAGSKTVTVNVVVLDSPSAPKKLVAKDVTRESVTLSWEAPENDGGSVVNHYIVEKKETTKKAWSTVTMTCVRTSFKVLNLNEGMSYYFRVMAENEYGIGAACETPGAIKASEVPSAPGRLEVTQTTANSISLAWAKPEADGGSKVIGMSCLNRLP